MTRVIPDSPAASLDIEVGDIILKYNNADIATAQDLTNAKQEGPDVVDMILKRHGKEITVSIPRGRIGVFTKACYD